MPEDRTGIRTPAPKVGPAADPRRPYPVDLRAETGTKATAINRPDSAI
jgi:hypothetical protein